jgi:2-oxo-4-hydroxy-4-carboxy-5-ureidoimidazoline decarboxylase
VDRRRMPQKITVDRVNRLSREGFVERLGPVYEHSSWVAEQAYGGRPFNGFDGLHGAMVRAVEEAPEGRRMALILAHPDLAGRAAMAGELTLASKREQASAGLDALSPGEYREFHRLNDAYKEKFGFPLIFAVREHTKETILAGAERRLEHSRPEEIETALAEISKIARLRLEDLVEED